MSLPVQKASPGTPGFSREAGQKELLAAARRAHNAKHRTERDGGRLPLSSTAAVATGTGTGIGPPSGAAATIANTAVAAVRRQSLRRVKDSREELRRTRARGTSNATLESSTTNNTAPSGRSFTVANINNGIIYLRYVQRGGRMAASGRGSGAWHRCPWAREKFVCEHEHQKETDGDEAVRSKSNRSKKRKRWRVGGGN